MRPLDFAQRLWNEIQEDDIFSGAAALAYYLMLAIFPAAISLLNILAFLPIPNLQSDIMGFIVQTLPGDAASLFSSVLNEVLSQRSGGLLSFGLLLSFWAASSGLYAIMQQLNTTYEIRESRPFWKTRGLALLLSLLFFLLVVGAFALVVLGDVLHGWLARTVGVGDLLLAVFTLFRWLIISGGLLLGFALIYYFGPDVRQRFRLITPGSVAGATIWMVASLVFRFYVTNFGNYSKSYGSLGAVIILLLWLYNAGLALLIGSEINVLLDSLSPKAMPAKK